jgi:hypothetical protein
MLLVVLIGETDRRLEPGGTSELHQLHGRAIADATLDAAHAAAADMGDVRQSFLGQLAAFAQLADTSAESLESGMLSGLAGPAGLGTARDERSESRRFPTDWWVSRLANARWRAQQDSNLRPPGS